MTATVCAIPGGEMLPDRIGPIPEKAHTVTSRVTLWAFWCFARVPRSPSARSGGCGGICSWAHSHLIARRIASITSLIIDRSIPLMFKLIIARVADAAEDVLVCRGAPES